MPEGQEGMPTSPENSPQRPSLSREDKIRVYFAKLPFREVIARENTLFNLVESLPDGNERKAKASSSLEIIQRRKERLVEEVKNKGKLNPVDQKLDAFRAMGKQFTPERLAHELEVAGTLDREAGVSESDKHYGVIEWYYRKGLDEISEDLKNGGVMTPPAPSVSPQEELLRRTAEAVEMTAKAVVTQVETAEPEIEKIALPETAAECVTLIEGRLFDLLRKAITDKKPTDEYKEYIAIERLIKRIPEEDVWRGMRHERLSAHLASDYPEGVYLKEKLTLLLKAMKNLTDRTVEVILSGGDLMKLGVGKSEIPLARKMVREFRNIDPVDWYVLTHLCTLPGDIPPEVLGDPKKFKEMVDSSGTLFPESILIPETRLDIQLAWEQWRNIGDRPYIRLVNKDKNGNPLIDKDGNPDYIKDKNGNFIYRQEVILDYVEKKDKQGKPIKDAGGKIIYEYVFQSEKAKRRPKLEKGDPSFTEGDLGITLSDIYRSTDVESLVKTAIAREIGGGRASEREVRSELLAWCFLKVGLTFDLWDRERWKIKADSGARDLIWFPFKQVQRALYFRSGKGLLNTAGSYWSYVGQSELHQEEDEIDSRLKPRMKEVSRLLKTNEERATFRWSKGSAAQGTVVGDFWSSTTFNEKGKKVKFLDRDLADIPFLEHQSQTEEGAYESYFSYSLNLANSLAESFMNAGGRDWGVENFMTPGFWERMTDLLGRLKDYCPTMYDVPKDKQYWALQKLARTFARGIFWLGSYQAQPTKEFLGVHLPNVLDTRRGVYTLDQVRTVKEAIKSSAFLDKENYSYLLKEIQEFKFYQKAAKVAPRRR